MCCTVTEPGLSSPVPFPYTRAHTHSLAPSAAIRSALARWFSVGLLQLQRITWEDTPGQLLVSCTRDCDHLVQLQHMLQCYCTKKHSTNV